MLPKELQTLIDNMNLPKPTSTPTVASMVGDFNKIANNVAINQGLQPNIQLPEINIPQSKPFIPSVSGMISDFNSFAPSTFDFDAELEKNRIKTDLNLNTDSETDTAIREANRFASWEWLFWSLDKLFDSGVSALWLENSRIFWETEKIDNLWDAVLKTTLNPLWTIFDILWDKEKSSWKKSREQIKKAVWEERVQNYNLNTEVLNNKVKNRAEKWYREYLWDDFFSLSDDKWLSKVLQVGTEQAKLDLAPRYQSREIGYKRRVEEWDIQWAELYKANTEKNLDMQLEKNAKFQKEMYDLMNSWKSIAEAEVIMQRKYNEMWYKWINWYFADWFIQDDGSTYDGRTIYERLEWWMYDSTLWYRTRKDLYNNQQNYADLEWIKITDWYSLVRKWYGYFNKILSPLFQTASVAIWELWAQTVGTTIWFASSAADKSDELNITFWWGTEWSWRKAYKFANDIFDVLPELITNLAPMPWLAKLQWLNALKWAVLRAPWYMSRINKALSLVNIKPLSFLNKVDNSAVVANLLKQWGKTGLAEWIMNAWFDSTQQSANSQSNFEWNLLASIIWFIPEVWELAKSWRKLYSQQEWISIIDTNYKLRKKLELQGQWKTREEADEAVNKMQPSKYLVDWDGKQITIDEQFVDNVLKQKEIALETRNSITDWLKKSIDYKTKEIQNIKDPEIKLAKEAELAKDVMDYDWFMKWYNNWLSQELALNKLLRDWINDKNITEFAEIIKTWIVWAKNPEEYASFLTRYGMWLWWTAWKTIVDAVELWSWNLARSYQIDNFSKATWYDISNMYDEKWFNNLINDINEKATTYKRLLELWEDDWAYKYWAKTTDWYVLNDKWMKRMWTQEYDVSMNLRRKMTKIPEWSEEAKFLETIKSADYWIDEKTMQEIEDYRVYDTLLKNINDFIPCLP